MTDYLKRYGYTPDINEINRCLGNIAASLENFSTEQVLKDCFSMMDLTSLKTQDTEASIAKLVRKVNDFQESYPDFPNPASICVFSNFAKTVKEVKTADDVHITVVSACFPSSQSFLEVKLKECELAVRDGADEVDIVLALNAFMAGDCERAAEEIRQVRKTIDAVAAEQGRTVHLKVILETGALKTAENIYKASLIAMAAGADFIKTSTGKIAVNATPEATFIMCHAIKAWKEKAGIKMGYKPAGGVSTTEEAVQHFTLVKEILGEEWLTNKWFRMGTSRLANILLSDILGEETKFF